MPSLKACVVCGADDLGDSFRRLAGCGGLPGAGLAGCLKRFLARFAGVSTRRLPHCLAWFERAEQVRRPGPRPARVMSGQAAAGRYGSTRADLFAAPRPFWECREEQASMSTVV